MTEGECHECSYARKARCEKLIGCSLISSEDMDSINKYIPQFIPVYAGYSYANSRPNDNPGGIITGIQLILQRDTRGCTAWKPK